MINRDFFFEQVRKTLFGSLKQTQVDGLNAILDEWDAKYKNRDDRWLAYMLGTVHHETDKKFQGIEEYGSAAYFAKYNNRKDLGNGPNDGALYKGRGFVQITGRANYTNFTRWLKNPSVDLVNHPELALLLPNSIRILFDGMVLGHFTGKKLADYFNPTTADWVNARRIVNRLNKANIIADYSKTYYAAISYTT